MSPCPSCSAENSQASKFCSECGAALTPEFAATVTRGEDGVSSNGSHYSSLNESAQHGQFLPGTRIADRYRIVSLVGKGGMGEVYRADDLKLGHTVALKFLPKNVADNPKRLDYFHSEVRLTRQISHPNVCRVYDIGEFEGQHFLSMEFVDGEDLRGLLRRIGRLPKDKGVEIARQLCAGLSAAHDKGVLHRDLKPANIMIDGRGQARITDFGLARLTEDPAEGEIAGTPAYMAPEQLSRGQTTIQSDLYSLGLILHELFTGEAVYKSKSIPELLREHEESGIGQPSELVDDMDPAIERVILRCLRKEAHERPKSAREIAAALPGGDPLLAALEAGETPSPELVAAAGDDTGVDPRIAVAALVGIAVCLLLNLWLADHTSVVNRSQLDHEPAVLRDEVREMFAEDFGYEETPGETIHDFGAFPHLFDGETVFWQRQCPEDSDFGMNGFWSSYWGRLSWARPDFFQPVWDEPGEMGVILSGDKRLSYFRAVPPIEIQPDRTAKTPRWSEWFTPKRTGFYLPLDENDLPSEEILGDAQRLEIVEDRWRTPPDAFDAVGVWQGRDPDDESTFLVVAAAFRGKPTYFRRFSEEEFERSKGVFHSSSEGFELGSALILSLYGALFIVGCVLTWRNLRSGRGDRLGGKRLAGYVFAVNTVVLLTFCRHTTHVESEVAHVFIMGVSQILFETARTWVWYMALEPYVRRVWPQTLISSSRLLDGRLRDSLIGRDILAGILFGALSAAVWKLNHLVQAWLSVAEPPLLSFDYLSLSGGPELIGSAFAGHAWSFNIALFSLLLLLIGRIVLKSQRSAIVAYFLIMSIILTQLYGGHLGVTFVWASIHIGVILLVLVRFGILALVVKMTTFALMRDFPLTLDTGNWYFGHGMFPVVLIAALTLYGFYASLGNQRKAAATVGAAH